MTLGTKHHLRRHGKYLLAGMVAIVIVIATVYVLRSPKMKVETDGRSCRSGNRDSCAVLVAVTRGKDSSLRARAFEAIPDREQDLLAEIAETARDGGVRLRAVEKLKGQNLLAEVVAVSLSDDTRQAALQRLTDRSALTKDWLPELRGSRSVAVSLEGKEGIPELVRYAMNRLGISVVPADGKQELTISGRVSSREIGAVYSGVGYRAMGYESKTELMLLKGGHRVASASYTITPGILPGIVKTTEAEDAQTAKEFKELREEVAAATGKGRYKNRADDSLPVAFWQLVAKAFGPTALHGAILDDDVPGDFNGTHQAALVLVTVADERSTAFLLRILAEINEPDTADTGLGILYPEIVRGLGRIKCRAVCEALTHELQTGRHRRWDELDALGAAKASACGPPAQPTVVQHPTGP